jgi:hypothetical protein
VPTQLGDVEVLVNGVASPLVYRLPWPDQFHRAAGTPVSGAGTTPFCSGYTADLEVVQVSTGQVLGAAQVPMNSVAPGRSCTPAGQTGRYGTLCRRHQSKDGTINSASNPALPGDYVSIYLTGEGAVPRRAGGRRAGYQRSIGAAGVTVFSMGSMSTARRTRSRTFSTSSTPESTSTRECGRSTCKSRRPWCQLPERYGFVAGHQRRQATGRLVAVQDLLLREVGSTDAIRCAACRA